MLRNNLLLAGIILFAGCASTPQPGIQIQTQKVEVPIAVPCKAVVPLTPAWNFDKLTINQDIFFKDQVLLADRLFVMER